MLVVCRRPESRFEWIGILTILRLIGVTAPAHAAPPVYLGANRPAIHSAASAPRSVRLPSTPDQITVYSINEFDNAADAPALSASIPSQDWVRAWFKWANAPDLRGQENFVRLAHNHGALLGGGVTCSALYRGENGISAATFMDLATRDPNGQLFTISGAYYHGATANPAYLRYVLKWAEQQIDAGVDTLFMDEVSGVYSSHEGCDSYGLAAFRDYLTRRFITQAHWTSADPRWQTRFKIDLSRADECPDRTIRTFDYSAYLRDHGWADQPDQAANPLWPIWGDPNAITGDSFSAARNNRVWKYYTTTLRAYAARHHRRVWLAANGLNRWVDYQIAGMWGGFPKTASGVLSTTGSYLAQWRGDYARSRTLMDSKDVPIMVFHDWGDGMPWEQLKPAERVAWLDAYAPEVFAAGLFFAYPVHGPFGSDASTDGTLATIQSQARFVRRIAPLLHGVQWQDPGAGAFSGRAEITIQAQPAERRLVVHLINRDYDALTPRVRTDGRLRLALAVRPTRVILYQVEGAVAKPAAWTYSPIQTLSGRSRAGVLSVTVPQLRTWDVLRIDLPRWTPLPGAATIRISCDPVWDRPDQNQFLITSASAANPSAPNGFLQGKLHPELRSPPTFVVRTRRIGAVRIHVNSVAQTGARLVVNVDGHPRLTAAISDRDGKNAATANEINHTYTIPLGPGRHKIRAENDGPDWLTVDWYEFSGL